MSQAGLTVPASAGSLARTLGLMRQAAAAFAALLAGLLLVPSGFGNSLAPYPNVFLRGLNPEPLLCIPAVAAFLAHYSFRGLRPNALIAVASAYFVSVALVLVAAYLTRGQYLQLEATILVVDGSLTTAGWSNAFLHGITVGVAAVPAALILHYFARATSRNEA